MCNSKSPNNPVLQARGVGGGFSEENAVVSAVLMGLGLGWGWGRVGVGLRTARMCPYDWRTDSEPVATF